MSGFLERFSRLRPSYPTVVGVELNFDPPLKAIDLSGLLLPAEPRVFSLPVTDDAPRAITIPITNPPVRVRSFVFPEPAAMPALPAAAVEQRSKQAVFFAKEPSAQSTRIKPPGDVIKLEDRLHYLLQPSLETLLHEGDLTFPCRPYPYQFEGMAFLYPRHAAILADEMGLGKTMQAITAIRLLLHRLEVRRVLLVCPKTLVTNWQREFSQWAPELPVLVIEGDQSKRAWQWRLPDVPVRIANYEILLRDREIFENSSPLRAPTEGWSGEGPGVRAELPGEKENSPHPNPLRAPTEGWSGEGTIAPVNFDLVLLDESQRIKNRLSATSQIVRSISRKRSWALTGTPVENSTDDLVGIFEFLAPGFLSPDMKPRKMGRTISDYILRRTKDQVLADLPPKIVHDEQLELTPEQRESYNLAEDEGVLRLTELGLSATIRHVFELILRLKQICNFDPAAGTSAKLERLEADLEEIAQSGRKAIVFSQWVATIEKLSGHLARFGPLEYHGRIPTARRDGIIERFRADDSSHVLLMTYGAGGLGLNLQMANYVFLFDRWWNPAVEDQAINRAHRIGIDGPVYVTRFLMLDTIEERIERILQEKRDLFDTIFSDAAAHQKLGLTQEELFGLFQIKCPTAPIDKAA
ncbi:MAG: DEAD/DEAH box helicase [Thermoguttaceae bacterium]